MTSEIAISEGLCDFIKEHTNDNYALQLILFFADHPYARFNKLAIIHALNQEGGSHSIHEAIGALIDKGIIKTWLDSNVVLYSLAEHMRSPILKLAKLDTHQWSQSIRSSS